MNGNKKYNIVFCSDNWYAMQLCVAAYSTIKNFSKKEDLNIFVLDAWISDINKKKILDSCSDFNVPVIFKEIDCSLFKKYVCKWYNEYTYARLLIEKIFIDLDIILYLDCDIVVNWDLSKLLDINIENYSAWASQCELNVSDDELNSTYKHIWVWNPMFCAGVMLINIEWWRKNKVLEKSLKYLDKNRQNLMFADQDVLNNLLHDSIFFIPPKYNTTNTILYSHFYQEMVYKKTEYLEAKKHPVVIHFAWWSRPWNWDCFHKWNRIWRRYLKETKFKWRRLPTKNNFTAKRYKFLMWKIISDFVSLFWYRVYKVFLSFWRNFIV